jgi:probable rRNA maturation factor
MINIKCSKKLNSLIDLYNDIIKETIKTFDITDKLEINVEFVSRLRIKKINRLYRNINKVTDVLSFPTLEVKEPLNENLTMENFAMDINPETENIMLGDIYINYGRVKSQAKEYGHSITRESCYLFLHGVLHLLGFDHMVESDKQVMRKYEELILNNLNIQRN